MGISIGTQNAVTAYTVEGVQVINHGSGSADADQLRALLLGLRGQLRDAPLPPAAVQEATGCLVAVEAELAGPRPDRNAMARQVNRLSELLRSYGALAASGTALVTSVQALVAHLG